MTNIQGNKNVSTELKSSILIQNQKKLILAGVQEFYSTNDKLISIKLNGKKLLISGENINITKLIVETGELEADGVFDSIKFNSTKDGNVLKRMFK